MKVIIEMSGADVLLVKPGAAEIEVEVRQLHQDFYGDDPVLEDEVWPGCTYTVAWPPPRKPTRKKPQLPLFTSGDPGLTDEIKEMF